MAKKEAGTDLVQVKAQLAKEREDIAKRIVVNSGDQIRCTQDKKFKTPDGQESSAPLRMVILDFISTNKFFDRPYSPGDATPPACFAIGDDPQGLVPSDKSPDKQAETCGTCPNNEFGSRGEGKACGNHRILALADPTGKDPKVYLMTVQPTAVRAFDGYVATLKAQHDALPIEMSTEIYFSPDSKYPSLRFANPEPNEHLAAHFALRKAAQVRLRAEPDVSQWKPVQVRKPAGKPAGKR